MAIQKAILLAVLMLSLPMPGVAQTSKEANEANNPLTPKITANVQDQYISSYYGLDSDSNALLLRGVLPHKLFDAAVATRLAPCGRGLRALWQNTV